MAVPPVRRHVLEIGDLSEQEIRNIIGRALVEQDSGSHLQRRTVGLLFLSASLRTRVGYAAAAARLGWDAIVIDELRWSREMSSSESFEDTIRTVTGMVDLLVLRTPFPLDRELISRSAVCPVVNGGDFGGEHPSQALIDFAAIEAECGSVDQLDVVVSGDLSSRVARSFLAACTVLQPKSLTLVGLGGEAHPSFSEFPLHDVATRADVVYLPGLAAEVEGQLVESEVRRQFAVTEEVLGVMKPSAVVLSPMPVIDEVSEMARNDPRVRFFEQSDRGVFVRASLMRWILEGEC